MGEAAMRPESIRKFDLFYLAAIAIGIASSLLNFEQVVAGMEQQLAASGLNMDATGMVIGSNALGIGVSLILWFFASRMRQGWVKWVLLLLLMIQAASIPGALTMGVGTLSITMLIVVLLKAIAIWFLFRPDAKEWFASS